VKALILPATLGGPTMFARIGVMRAVNRHVVREFIARIIIGKAQAGAGPMTDPPNQGEGKLVLASNGSCQALSCVFAATTFLFLRWNGIFNSRPRPAGASL
jgi:hypothetical protein